MPVYEFDLSYGFIYIYIILNSENICRLPNDPGIHCSGIANSAVTRFYFDMISGSCRSFNYKQCGGNDNNFKTLNQCQEFCQSRKSLFL